MTYGPTPRWTPERDAVIKAMRAEQVPYARIAAHLGETANAVIGRAHRIGLNGGAKANPAKKPAKVAPPDDSVAVSAGSVLRQISATSPAPVPTRRAGGCQWPMWADDAPPDFHFCGEARATATGSYCASHEAKAWAQAPSPHSLRMREVWAKRLAKKALRA